MCFQLLNTKTIWDSDGSLSMSRNSKQKRCSPTVTMLEKCMLCVFSRRSLTIWIQVLKRRGILFGLGHDPLAESPVQMFHSPMCVFCGMQLLTHARTHTGGPHILRLWFPIWYKADNLGNVWDIAGCRWGQVRQRRMWEVGLYVCFANVDLMILSRWLLQCKSTSGLLICRLTSSDWD